VLIFACIFFANKKKDKLSPYQIWSTHYSNKQKEPEPVYSVNHANEDIHHFYNRSPRPSINQHPVFTPHLSSKIAYRNSQMAGQLGSQRNSQSVAMHRGSVALQERGDKSNFSL